MRNHFNGISRSPIWLLLRAKIRQQSRIVQFSSSERLALTRVIDLNDPKKLTEGLLSAKQLRRPFAERIAFHRAKQSVLRLTMSGATSSVSA